MIWLNICYYTWRFFYIRYEFILFFFAQFFFLSKTFSESIKMNFIIMFKNVLATITAEMPDPIIAIFIGHLNSKF